LQSKQTPEIRRATKAESFEAAARGAIALQYVGQFAASNDPANSRSASANFGAHRSLSGSEHL
jgi:hypothetical protein